MNYEQFFEEANRNNIKLELTNAKEQAPHQLGNEALFHLPLLAMTILMLSKTQRKPRSSELGQLVGECFERVFVGFKGSSQYLGWSANLRVRTVKALTFLEAAELVKVDSNSSKILITDGGKKVIERVLKSNEQDDMSYTCLLYTSPSPRDATLSRMPSSA